jgi:3-carboxy-cis,cis-muconate cycloisomerase
MSSIFESFLATSEVVEALSDSNFVAAMLRFEAALARAQASVGLIPQSAAQSIVGTCKVDLFDVPKLVRESGRTHCMASPLVSRLRETVGLFNQDAERFVHLGCSSQDVIDSAMALVTRDVLALITADLSQTIAVLLALAARHAGDPMLARTQQQPVSMTTFGLKCSHWAAPLLRSQQRLQSAADNALSVRLGGAAGTLAEMKGKGQTVIALMATDLKLKDPSSAWPTQHAEKVALACELGLLIGNLGEIAKDIAFLSQPDVGELAAAELPAEPTRGVAVEAAPHSRNTATCMVALAAAKRAPQQVATLLACMSQESERDLGNWQAELAEWPSLMLSAHGATRAVFQLLSGLQVNSQRMRANLDAQRSALPAKLAAVSFSPELAERAAELTLTQIKALEALNKATAVA